MPALLPALMPLSVTQTDKVSSIASTVQQETRTDSSSRARHAAKLCHKIGEIHDKGLDQQGLALWTADNLSDTFYMIQLLLRTFSRLVARAFR